jgi:hypothetical protein
MIVEKWESFKQVLDAFFIGKYYDEVLWHVMLMHLYMLVICYCVSLGNMIGKLCMTGSKIDLVLWKMGNLLFLFL